MSGEGFRRPAVPAGGSQFALLWSATRDGGANPPSILQVRYNADQPHWISPRFQASPEVSMTDEQAFVNKLREIEASFAGSGGTDASAPAADALAHILARLRKAEEVDPPTEYRFTLNNRWSTQLFTALLRRYRITPYRY